MPVRFLGTFTPRLDDKGRLFLPAKYRDQLAEGIVITKGQDRCLFVYTQAEFDRQYDELAEADPADEAKRLYARQVFGSAFDDVPDKSGRVTVPAPLRAYARLDRDCVVVGLGRRLEIWDAEAWAAHEARTEPGYAGSGSAADVPQQPTGEEQDPG